MCLYRIRQKDTGTFLLEKYVEKRKNREKGRKGCRNTTARFS